MKTSKHLIWPFKSATALRTTYGETLVELGADDEDIVVLDADLSTSTKTSLFRDKYPARHFDMGIAEADMIGTAAGMAAAGLTPFATSFAMFAIGRTYDQIRNAVCYADLPVRIVATHAGITVGEDGGSHQMIEDIAMMRVVPNMSVLVPADAEETAQMIRYAAGHKHPIYVRLPRDKFPDIYTGDYSFEFGKWDVPVTGSGEVVVFAAGLMVSKAIEAAAILEKGGISMTVVNASTIDPVDRETLLSVTEKAKLVVTAEEALVAGGLGGLVSEELAANRPLPVLRIGISNRFGESGDAESLIEGFRLRGEDVADDIKERWDALRG